MEKKFCDRCNNEIERSIPILARGYKISKSFNEFGKMGYNQLDLCTFCYNSFLEWLSKKSSGSLKNE